MLRAIVACLCLAANIVAGENLLFNGDIEAAADKNPPPGWTMWGDAKWKDPVNFTREMAQPHGGTACLRIHHPAKTAGYIVTSPDHAIETKKGMCYTLAFWARADKPGRAVVAFEGYEQLKPTFIGSPSPGSFSADVGREWKSFTYETNEGWDFFARRTRYVLLLFKATREQNDEQTLYIDDVSVTETPSKRDGRLLEREELTIPPLDHRLARGDQLSFSVDAAKKVRRATHEAGGISFHRVAGWAGVPYDKAGEYVLKPELEKAVADLHLPMTRFYAVGDEPFGLEGGIDRAAELCKRAGVPTDKVVLELETQGATSILAPDVWARGARYAHEKGYGFFRWEITNEPYVSSAKVMFPIAEVYAEHFKAVAPAVRAAQPASKIGLSIHGRDIAWGDYLLKRCSGLYDFIVPHWYCFVELKKSSFEDVVLRANAETLDEVLRVNALAKAYNPGRDVYQYDTEWGLHTSGLNGDPPGQNRRNGNIVGTLHRAVRLIYYTREDLLRGASSWEMFVRSGSPGFGILTPDAPDKRYMIYWLYYHFNRHVGESVVATEGTAPYYEWTTAGKTVAMPLTPVLATLSADGKTLYLVIVNGSWNKPAPCSVKLLNFAASSAKAVVLSQDSQDADPLIAKEADAVSDLPVALEGESARFTLPPHAVAFVTIPRKE